MVGNPPGAGESATTEVPPATSLPPTRGRGRRVWLVAGAVLLVVLLVIAYLAMGASAAGGSVHRANRALKTTLDHQETVNGTLAEDVFKGIDLSSPNADVSAARAVLAKFEPRVSQAMALVEADRAALAGARPGLQGSVLTMPERGRLERDRKRVDAANLALISADLALGYDRQQDAFLHPFFDTFAQLQTIEKTSQVGDLAGMLAKINTAGDSLQKSMALAKPPAIPVQVLEELQTLRSLLDDVKSLLTAAQAHDFAAVQKWSAAADADANRLSSYDSAAVDTADKALFQPLSDEYRSQMKIAAGD